MEELKLTNVIGKTWSADVDTLVHICFVQRFPAFCTVFLCVFCVFCGRSHSARIMAIFKAELILILLLCHPFYHIFPDKQKRLIHIIRPWFYLHLHIHGAKMRYYCPAQSICIRNELWLAKCLYIYSILSSLL